MTEVAHRVYTYELHRLCDVCNQGYMEYHQPAIVLYPDSYLHVCNKCGYKTHYEAPYPRYVHERKPREGVVYD